MTLLGCFLSFNAFGGNINEQVVCYFPDGDKYFVADMEGDEFYSYYSLNGYSFVLNEQDKIYYYAELNGDGELVPSDLVVTKDPPPAFSLNLGPEGDFLAQLNEQRLERDKLRSKSVYLNDFTLNVILIEFEDVKHNNPNYHDGRSLDEWYGDNDEPYSLQEWELALASENEYHDPSGSMGLHPDGVPIFGSLVDYFNDMSQQTININVNILNPPLNLGEPDGEPFWIPMQINKTSYHGSVSQVINRAGDFGINIPYPTSSEKLAIVMAGNMRTDGYSPQAPTDRYYYTVEQMGMSSNYELNGSVFTE